MNYRSGFLSLLIGTFLGCNSPSIPSNLTAPASPPENGVTTLPATPAQCPSGGVVVETFVDTNANGLLDPGETIVSQTPICDGANGQAGLGSGIQVSQASTTQCPAGGLRITTFMDPNNTGILESGDAITSLNTVCNGTSGTNGTDGNSFSVSQTAAAAAQCSSGGTVYTVIELNGGGGTAGSASSSVICNGSNGIDGTAGANGLGMVFSTLAATSGECPYGGNVILIASDTAGTGVFNDGDANPQSIVVCNGASGAQGPAGPVSPDSPVSPIMPCGADSSPFKEVLLCLADGNILADFSADSSGDLTRLSFIPAGTYEDTDSSGCVFAVSADGTGGNRVSWSAGQNSYAAWDSGSVDCPATAAQ